MKNHFLPLSRQECLHRGWDELDIILVTGDAYVDHPSYGMSIIGRVLEAAGFRVGIIAQPDWKKAASFTVLGRPRLFFGVSAGNLDSMIANYTAAKKPRRSDDYSPGGASGLRPDRATIIYANKIREAYRGTTIVIGGIEASLRRLAHYDYWSETLRHSILLDTKADILVYGMGEKQIVEIARRLSTGEKVRSLNDIRGTVIARSSLDGITGYKMLPSFEAIVADKLLLNEETMTLYREADPHRGHPLVQQDGTRFVIQLPPPKPVTPQELDALYELPYARTWHPRYDSAGGVPGFETVRASVVSHRGCAGECSFCSLSLHQGRIIQSRSEKSILNEIRLLAAREDFRGTITDIGGPTANLYEAYCTQWKTAGACAHKSCLAPARCQKLALGYKKFMRLLTAARAVPGVKHVFIGSGVRYDLLTEPAHQEMLRMLCAHHTSGRLKVAPEHKAAGTLRLMHKPPFSVYEKFIKHFAAANAACGKEQFLVNYFIVGHPGTTLQDALDLALWCVAHHLQPEQIQDFIPLPLTISGAMYYTGHDPATGTAIAVPSARQRRLQRALLQYRSPENRKLIFEALDTLGRLDLKKVFTQRYG